MFTKRNKYKRIDKPYKCNGLNKGDTILKYLLFKFMSTNNILGGS